MRRYNIVSRIFLILIVITFALAAPVQVQEKRQAPKDVITVLGKRILEEDFNVLWDGLWHFKNVWGEHAENVVEEHELEAFPLQPNLAEEHVPEVHAPPPNLPFVLVPEGHAPPPNPADSDRESMELDDDAPPGTPQSSPESTAETEYWTPPSSPRAESSTESYSDSDHRKAK